METKRVSHGRSDGLCIVKIEREREKALIRRKARQLNCQLLVQVVDGTMVPDNTERWIGHLDYSCRLVYNPLESRDSRCQATMGGGHTNKRHVMTKSHIQNIQLGGAIYRCVFRGRR